MTGVCNYEVKNKYFYLNNYPASLKIKSKGLFKSEMKEQNDTGNGSPVSLKL